MRATLTRLVALLAAAIVLAVPAVAGEEHMDPFSREYRPVLETKIERAQELVRTARPERKEALTKVAASLQEARDAFDAYQPAYADFKTKEQKYKALRPGSERNQALLDMQGAQVKAATLAAQYAFAGTKVAVAIDDMKRQNRQETAALDALSQVGRPTVPRQKTLARIGSHRESDRPIRMLGSVADPAIIGGDYAQISQQVGRQASAQPPRADNYALPGWVAAVAGDGRLPGLAASDRAPAAAPAGPGSPLYVAPPEVQAKLPAPMIPPVEARDLPPWPDNYVALTLRPASNGSASATGATVRRAQPVVQVGSEGQSLDVAQLVAGWSRAAPVARR